MYTLFLIKMPSKGNKTIVSRMIKDVPSNYTIKDSILCEEVVASMR